MNSFFSLSGLGVCVICNVSMLWVACCTIAGIEVLHAIRKGQLEITGDVQLTPAEQLYGLAA